MASIFLLKEPPKDANCVICLVETNDEFVAHISGENHPLHEKCMKRWLFNKPECPVCRTEIDASCLTLLDRITVLKDRSIDELCMIKNDMFAGMKEGALRIVSYAGLGIVIRCAYPTLFKSGVNSSFLKRPILSTGLFCLMEFKLHRIVSGFLRDVNLARTAGGHATAVLNFSAALLLLDENTNIVEILAQITKAYFLGYVFGAGIGGFIGRRVEV